MKKTSKGVVSSGIHPLVRISYPFWMARKASRNLEKHSVRKLPELAGKALLVSHELWRAAFNHQKGKGEASKVNMAAVELGALCVEVLVSMAENYGVENVFKALGIALVDRDGKLVLVKSKNPKKPKPVRLKKGPVKIEVLDDSGSTCVSQSFTDEG